MYRLCLCLGMRNKFVCFLEFIILGQRGKDDFERNALVEVEVAKV